MTEQPSDTSRAWVEIDLGALRRNGAAIARWSETGAPWHLGIDTGMARAGVRWDRVGDVASLLAALPPEGACTHFHSATDAASVRQQRERFATAVAALYTLYPVDKDTNGKDIPQAKVGQTVPDGGTTGMSR